MADLISLSLYEAAQKLEAGEVTSVDLCTALLDRQAAVEDKVNAFLHSNRDKVLAAAKESDERRTAGNAKGRFDGVPLAVKDNIVVEGEPCTCASQILKDFVSPYDATVITKLKDEGFIFCGRTNLDEFAMGSSTENSSFKTTANPWNLDHVPGGSSGGSAAAVSAQEAYAALGSDTGGSIRQPAGFCGVVGLKPSYGRISRYGLVAFASSLDQIGPLTKDVRDSAILLDAMQGIDKMDSTSLPETGECFEDLLDGADLKGMRFGMPKEYFDVEGLSDEVRESVLAVVEKLKAAGAEIVDVTLPNSKYAIASYYVIATAEASANLARFDGIRYGYRDAEADEDNLLAVYRKSREGGFGKEVKRRIILGTYVLSSGYYDAYYLRAQKVRTLIRNDFEKAFESCDAILTPVAPTTAFKKGGMSTPLEMYLADIYTISANLAGICGLSLPAGKGAGDLPIGIQLFGPAMGEAAILKAGHAMLENDICKVEFPEL